MNKSFALAFLFISLLFSNSSYSATSTDWTILIKESPEIIYTYKVIKTFPHNPKNFTEGLFLDDKFLYESAGLYQSSSLSRISITTGKLLAKYDLPTNEFAEGIAIVGSSLYQLTYLSHKVLVYDKNTFKLKQTFEFPTQGWGLTTDGHSFIASNGTSNLFYQDINKFKFVKSIQVKIKNHPVTLLNSLAYDSGMIFANVFGQDFILIIDAQTGNVIGLIDLRTLFPEHERISVEAVLNGIAYDKATKHLFITGKNWPLFYEIEVIKKSANK